ncbi:AAA family ATPase [Tenacibaculum mesophilum]|uniref:AAA family ATPase n=1 Tax=Tenacibaculum mesophilum TaxID=104268 RepID=A0AAE9MND2_9FLAO|nr:AAA family ATPase [Tenacibaculum mesophilum]UTD14933.1 AAA family ATPase [Tenacibaculum mesophilum]
MNNFKKLEINDWKMFQKIEIDFHPQLTILTGANGSGKTTILNILSRHFGWNYRELATPAKDKETGVFKFFTRLFKKPIETPDNSIGKIIYSNDSLSNLVLPQNGNNAQYHVQLKNQQPVQGLSIPSHRPTYNYRQVSNIPTQKRTRQQAYQLLFNSYRERYEHGGGQSSNYFIKETLLNWAIGGSGNEFIEADSELKENFRGFEKVLSKIMPQNIGFKSLTIRNYEIVLVTESGDFMLDAVSGGLSSIIDLAWQIYTQERLKSNTITVLIDEIENHLHASMQRSILPDLISAFPNVQFIVSTHSPLVVGSVKESFVHAFRYVDGRVVNEKLDLINKARNANEVLNEVLGVSFTMPIWVENYLNEVVEKYSKVDLTENIFDNLRNELKQVGLEELMPVAIKQSISKRND